MSFIDEIKGCFDLNELPMNPRFRAVMFGDCAVYVENVKTIASYHSEEILLCIKGGGLLIRGKNLYVKKFCAGDVAVCGKICSVECV